MMTRMVLSPAQAPSGPPRTLQPRDLFTDRATDDAVVVSMRTKSVHIKSTKAGQPWAVLEGQWRGHRLRCVVFPRAWATLERPSPGDAVVVGGKLAFRDGQPVIWVLAMTTISLV
jgi:hypothetical protein